MLLSFANLPTPVSGLWRPLIVAAAGALLLSAVFGVLLRSRWAGLLAGTVIVIAVSAAWLLVAVTATALLWFAIVSLLRRRRGLRPIRWPGAEAASRQVGVFGLMFVAVAAVSAVPAATASMGLEDPSVDSGETFDGAPDVFVILLDGYPRSDVLGRYLGLDNSTFEEALQGMGFEVERGARSNYSATWATLASMFHGRYLHEIPSLMPFATDEAAQYVSLMRALNEGAALAQFRSGGYRIVTVPSPFEAATLFTADEVRTSAELTFFELSLLQHSQLLAPLVSISPSLVLEQHRGRIENALASTVDLASEGSDAPRFVFTHLLSPHPPVVFDASGATAQLPACYPHTCTLWEMTDGVHWSTFPGQIAHLNRIVLDSLSRLTQVNPTAVVVVMSDHGSRPPGAAEDVLLDSLLAVRSIHATDLPTEDLYPVNLLPWILNAHLGNDQPMSVYRGWLNEPEHPLEMVEVESE